MCKIDSYKRVSFVKEGGVITDIPIGAIIRIEPRVINHITGMVMPRSEGKFSGYNKDGTPIFYQINKDYFGNTKFLSIPFAISNGDVIKIISLEDN